MVAARQSDLTYYGRQRCAAGWAYCRVGSQFARGWRQRRMQSGDVQQLVDDDERFKWSRRQSSGRPAERSMTAGFLYFSSFVDVKIIVFRFR
jgi:hypothetical protein